MGHIYNLYLFSFTFGLLTCHLVYNKTKLNFIIFFPEALGAILQKHNDKILLLAY